MARIFLDLDGTLTDPFEGIAACFHHALAALGREPPPAAELAACIGPPLQESLLRLLGDQALADEAVLIYRERYGRVGLYENRLYDGIPEALGDLQAAGHRLFLATSKAHVFARPILEHFALLPFFDEVFGAELDGTRSNKTDLLRHALAETAAHPGPAVMVGDRRHDLAGARNNAIPAVGVLYGYGSREELEAGGAAALATSPRDLPAVLAGVLEGLPPQNPAPGWAR